jgi:hypothetical protein
MHKEYPLRQEIHGLLLIEIFRKHFNPQNYGHQDTILGGLSRMLGVPRNSQISRSEQPETRGKARTMLARGSVLLQLRG